ncbi:MAG TPA: AsmA-like C-terminal region-containing protein [Bacteroidia bacterium]|nr:AsmA-like C-terminal region-containing protein [Bacteroidia bacterium]
MKKAIKIILIVLVVLIAGLISLPFLFKDKILAKVKTEINNNVNAKVDFSGFDLTIFKSFPNLTLVLDNLSVVGIQEFDGDTLAAIKQTSVTLDIMSVISGSQMEIRGVGLDNPRIQLLVLDNGKANWDIAKASSDSATTTSQPTQFKAALKKYEVTNGNILYDDRSLGFRLLMEGFNHQGSGDFTQDLFTLSTKSEIASLTMAYGGINYIYKAKATLEADLEMDMIQSKYTFKKNEIKLNELAMGFDGFILMPADDIDMDLKFDIRQNEFRHFISMIPGMYRNGFDKVQSKGKLAFNGFIKGKYNDNSMPGFGINLTVADGMFKYPDLPTAINNVSLDLNVANPDGVPDHTIINLKRLHVEMGKEPFDARMLIKTPVSDADINATLKGDIDLANISKLVPLETGTTLKGALKANVTAIGRLSSIENKKYEQFNASGTVDLTGFNYVSNDFKQGVSINTCELVFNPKNITLNKFDMKSGKTDIKATGWLDNFLSYLFKENELLKGTIDIKSSVIDLNEMMGESTSTSATDTTPMSVVEVPANIDFLMTASVGKIYYDDLILENAKGNIAVREKTLGLNGFFFNMLDGAVSMDGIYETKDLKKPSFYFDLDLTQLDIKKTYDKFVAVQKFTPIAEKCSGKYSTNFNVKGNLDSKMEPVLQTFTGSGKLSTKSVTVTNFTPLIKLADALKMDQFKSVSVDNVNLSFKFENGRINFEPYDVNIEGVKSTIQGSTGFDQTIDYKVDMNIPTSMMGNQATGVVTGLIAKANKSAGTNLSMGKEVKVSAKVTGTVNDPKIETGIKDMASNAVTDFKEQVKEEFDQKKKELEDKARSEADRLKNEAEAKAKAEAERLKKEAEAKAKAEADKAKKEAEELIKKQADEKLKNLFGKPK